MNIIDKSNLPFLWNKIKAYVNGRIQSLEEEIGNIEVSDKMDKENPSGNGTLSFNGNADFTGSIDAAGGFKVNGQDVTELITTIAVFE